MWPLLVSVCFIGAVENVLENDFLDNNQMKIEHFVYWPNGTIPFYINPEHFDHEQSTVILTALTVFAYKTCLKFFPALVAPSGSQHVLVFENPDGIKQCAISTTGHLREEPHYVTLGYNCLQSPEIDMMLMKALGFSFEHNRAIRDLYISVQKENVDPSAMDLFAMDDKLPFELRALPYDINSVMHFGEREYSKNGHRTIIILDHKMQQNRDGLSDLDLRKIDIVYGPECRKRDRLEKIDLCQGYPGVARRKREVEEFVRSKREVDPSEVKSLRVNPDITPPPELLNNTTEEPSNDTGVDKLIEDLGIKEGVEEITELVYKLAALALSNTRNKYCNNTNQTNVELNAGDVERRSDDKKPDIFGVIEIVAEYVKDMVDHAHSNLTAFCEGSDDFKSYQRQRCSWFSGASDRCPVVYKSTKHGPVMYSTQHRPIIVQSTKHYGGLKQRPVLYHQDHNRRDNSQANPGEQPESRRKRDLAKDGVDNTREKREVNVSKDANVADPNEGVERRFEGRRYNVQKTREGTWDESDVSMEKKHKRQRKKELEEEHNNVKERPGARHERREMKTSNAKGAVPKTVELSKKNQEFYGERKWQDGVVRYIVTEDKNFDLNDLRARLEAVNRILKERTCASIEEITEGDTERFEDYLVLDASADYVTGRVGGKQNFGSLELFEGGQHKQHAAMMVMAMLGFYFELARHDRDAYVRVHMRHVRPDKLHHFEKIRSDATLPLPYDYESATQPAWQFWRKLGKTGISTVATYKEKDPDGSIMRAFGQHDQLLSELDIVKINSVYGVHCFEKKPERENDEPEIGPQQDQGRGRYKEKYKEGREAHHGREAEVQANIHRLETWDRHKDYTDRHKNKEDGDDSRHRDREEHGRNRERHRNKHESERDVDLDNRESEEQDRDRGRHGSRHEQDRDEGMNRDRHDEGRNRDKHRIRPDEQEDDLDERDRSSERYRHKGRGRHNKESDDSDRHRNVDRDNDEEGRYEGHRKDPNRNRYQERDRKRQEGGRDMSTDEMGDDHVEEVIVYKERHMDNGRDFDDRNYGYQEDGPMDRDGGRKRPVGNMHPRYDEDMVRRGRAPIIFAPIKPQS